MTLLDTSPLTLPPTARTASLISIETAPRYRWLPLQNEVCCLVSPRHMSWITEKRWNYGWWPKIPHKFYAKRNEGAARSTIYLHREIMQRIDPQPEAFRKAHVVDHINGQSLDDRDENLRWATKLVNNLNRIPWDEVPTVEEIAEGLDAETARGDLTGRAPY
jgi:hypothetical protein